MLQLHYAALDAAVLVSIFKYLSATPPAKDWKTMQWVSEK